MTFNFQEFKKIADQQDVIEYAYEHLGDPLDSGSTRVVWKIQISGKILALKIASYQPNMGSGIEQNSKEVEVSQCAKGSSLITHVLKFDPGFKWVISEFATTPLNLADFQAKTGLTWKQFDIRDKNRNVDLKKLLRLYPTNKWLAEFAEVVTNCNIDLGDISPNNWGTLDGMPVILDYGYA